MALWEERPNPGHLRVCRPEKTAKDTSRKSMGLDPTQSLLDQAALTDLLSPSGDASYQARSRRDARGAPRDV